MRYELTDITTVFIKKGYQFDLSREYGAVNLIGIRTRSEEINVFNDLFYLHHIDKRKNSNLFEFEITTDPGKYWLLNPPNIKGTAIMVPGQYKNAYKLGLHKNSYEALIQAMPVKVFRDNNKNLILDTSGLVYTGFYGINIHRSNPENESVLVNKWSAGCQVFKRVKDYNYMISVCKNSGKELFTYTLLEEKDFD